MRTYIKLNGFFVIIVTVIISFAHLTVKSEDAVVETPTKIQSKIRNVIEGEIIAEIKAEIEAQSNAEMKVESNDEPLLSSQPRVEVVNAFANKPSRTISSEKNSKKEIFYKCGKGLEVRWLRLYYMKNGKCKTVYSKDGDAKDVSSANSYVMCESVLNNIKKNLESAGYGCEEKILMGSLELN